MIRSNPFKYVREDTNRTMSGKTKKRIGGFYDEEN